MDKSNQFEQCENCEGRGLINDDVTDREGNVEVGVGREIPCICQIAE